MSSVAGPRAGQATRCCAGAGAFSWLLDAPSPMPAQLPSLQPTAEQLAGAWAEASAQIADADLETVRGWPRPVLLRPDCCTAATCACRRCLWAGSGQLQPPAAQHLGQTAPLGRHMAALKGVPESCEAAQPGAPMLPGVQAIQGMKLLCTELGRLEQPDPAQPGQALPIADMSPSTTRLLRDSACDLVLDLCQKLHQVGRRAAPKPAQPVLYAVQAARGAGRLCGAGCQGLCGAHRAASAARRGACRAAHWPAADGVPCTTGTYAAHCTDP